MDLRTSSGNPTSITEEALLQYMEDKRPSASAEAALRNISKQRVKALQQMRDVRLGVIFAIRGASKSVETIAFLVEKKFTIEIENMRAEKDNLSNGQEPARKCMLITKVQPQLAKTLMPRLFEICLKLPQLHGGKPLIPFYDTKSEMVVICQICCAKHESTAEESEATKNCEHAPIHVNTYEEYNVHDGIVGIFTAGAADSVVMHECAMVLRLNGTRVRVYPRWTVQRVTHDLEVPDIMEACDVVIAIAGGEGTFPNIVGGLTTRPVIGIPTGTHGVDSALDSEVLCVMMNNCVPGIAVCNVDDGFNGAMQALSIIRQKNKHKLDSSSFVDNVWTPCFPRCVAALEEAKARGGGGAIDTDAVWERVVTIRREALEKAGKCRQGIPNILGGQKPPKQVLRELVETFNNNKGESVVYATRVTPETYAQMESMVQSDTPHMEYVAAASVCWMGPGPMKEGVASRHRGTVGVMSAGTADSPITAEAECILKLNGVGVRAIYDIGVNKIVRSMHHLQQLEGLDILIVAAGMEGTLPGFICSFTDKPVVALPTHIGYGTNKGGMTPMWAMLSSSSVGMVVVNIDNGFGAAMYALSVCRTIMNT